MLAVETVDLTKDYLLGFWRKRPKRALDRLSLGVEEGEVFGLLGPNGAGKTTALKLLLRIAFPTSGTARILGKELDDISAHARIGYLPEQPYFYDHLTAEELLNYVGEIFSIPAFERRQRVARLLERVGLVDSSQIPLRKFSKGMLQRIGIAQALINDPELIILDEPMSGLDPIGRREVRDLILELNASGKTVFFSTHILSDAETLCNRVAILNHGRLQGCGELGKMLSLEVAATEIVLENPKQEFLNQVKRCDVEMVRTGERVRLQVSREADVPKVLQIALQNEVKVISLNPIKRSLEDYFMAQTKPAPEYPHQEETALTSEGKR